MYRRLRRDIIELVLVTDMSKHFDELQLFKNYLPGLIQYHNGQVFHGAIDVCLKYTMLINRITLYAVSRIVLFILVRCITITELPAHL